MIHLITYGNNIFDNAKKRLYKEAKNTGWFDTITLYGPENLDTNFKEKFNFLSLGYQNYTDNKNRIDIWVTLLGISFAILLFKKGR